MQGTHPPGVALEPAGVAGGQGSWADSALLWLFIKPLKGRVSEHGCPSVCCNASQAGDSFDLATLACSLALGAGYDAAVVVGYVPKQVCKPGCNHISSPCPSLVASPLSDSEMPPCTPFRYHWAARRTFSAPG